MNFSDAMTKLKSGAKVSRNPWKDDIYFKTESGLVKSYQPKLSNFIYNEDIMISEGWLVDEDATERLFSDIIADLQRGSVAKLATWKDTFIYLDKSSKALVVYSMEAFPFTPCFNDFLAEDWMEIE